MLREGIVVWQRAIERPNDGTVADTGHCVVNDWRFGTGMDGIFYAFGPDGSVLIRQDFQANLFSSSVAVDGMLACCNTAYSDVESDSGKLAVFSVSPPRQGSFSALACHRNETARGGA